MIPVSEVFSLRSLVTPTPDGVVSRVLAKTPGGTVTLFAFAAGQGLSEHTSPYDALLLVLEGTFTVTVGGGQPLVAEAGTLVRLPANVPHALEAPEASRMLLILSK